jgi:hypothetical protein
MPIRNEMSYRLCVMSDKLDSASDRKVPFYHQAFGLICMLILALAILILPVQYQSRLDLITSLHPPCGFQQQQQQWVPSRYKNKPSKCERLPRFNSNVHDH